LSRSDPVDLTLLIKYWIPFMLGTVIPGNLLRNLLRHFLAEFHFTYDSYRKTSLFNSTSNHKNILVNTMLDTSALLYE
jgi:hypothetical protein